MMDGAGNLVWRCGDRTLRIGARPLVMGILNVTPDSFSDGGQFQSAESAVLRGLTMAREGADIVDVGGESTRPGALPVSEEDECARVIPVIRALSDAFSGRTDAPVISVDTRKAAVAGRAMEAGARIINDVTALGDPAMQELARCTGAGVVLMHMRGEPATMQQDPRYDDVVAGVVDWLRKRRMMLEEAGVAPDTMALDPGIGFGKTGEHNLKLLAGLASLVDCGRPVVVGISRKNFIGVLTGRDVTDRLAGSLAGAVWAASRGAHVWRVHEVKESVDAAKMVAALREETAEWNG
jgi:dihydropteroate synthase